MHYKIKYEITADLPLVKGITTDLPSVKDPSFIVHWAGPSPFFWWCTSTIGVMEEETGSSFEMPPYSHVVFPADCNHTYTIPMVLHEL
jgi:hypothetical protein